MSAARPSISIVIPCRNEARHIGGLLDAIRQQDTAILEVVIVDNSTDDTRRTIDDYCVEHPDLPVRVVPYDGPASIPAAVNMGVRHATGDIIVRLDGHSMPEHHYVGRAVAALELEGAGVVGGVWEIAPGAPTASAEAIASAASHPVGAGDAAYRIARAGAERRDVDTVPFGCYRKTLWTELGGLNEALLSNEDYEFNYRTHASGRRVILDPGIRSTYYARATLGGLAQQYFRYGWWKVQMLRRSPESLRWRQAVPAAFVAGFAALVSCVAALAAFAPTSPLLPLAGLALVAILALYVAALVAASLQICARRRAWRMLPFLPVAFATIHFAWGSGALVNLLTGGRR